MEFYKDFHIYGDNLAAVSDNGENITYSEITEFSDKLKDIIKKRCLVFSLCENSIGSLCGYLSFLRNKVVPLLIDRDLNRELLFNLIQTYKPDFLWVPGQSYPSLNTEVNVPMEIVYSEKDYVLLKTPFIGEYALYDALALLLTTSGSTGSPKLVRLSYKNIQSNAEAITQYLSITDQERPVTTLPMNYTYGLSVINSHVLKGATVLLTTKTLMEKDFWSFMKNFEATSMAGVPYTYEMLKRLRFFNMDLPALRTMTQAGGKLSIELTREFAEFCTSTNRRFFVMYGQTEATARMAYLPSEFALSKCGSMGVPIPGGAFKLINQDGQDINEPEVVGELVYQGPNVALGYAECGEDLSKGDQWKGVLFTGDMAKRDADGFYYITGRKNRFIKIYGNRVNLDETERLLKTILSECACTGTDDKMTIYITEQNRENEVRHFLSEKTGLNPAAFSVKVIEKIPKNEAGKTIYAQLKE